MEQEGKFYDTIDINGDIRNLKDNYGRQLIDENSKYTNSTPVPQAIGGIKKGDTFNNTPIKDILKNLLYPYVSFSASMTTNPSGGVKEYGTSITISSVNVSITLGSESIKSITVKDSANNKPVIN